MKLFGKQAIVEQEIPNQNDEVVTEEKTKNMTVPLRKILGFSKIRV